MIPTKTNPTEQEILRGLVSYGVSEDTATLAAKNLASGKCILLGVSGKMGAGKDTIAPRLLDALNYTTREQQSFATALRVEMGDVINTIISRTDGSTPSEIAQIVADEQGILVDDALRVVNALWDEVTSGAVTSAYDRTPGTRYALQQWGTEIRRGQDNDYWVKKAVGAFAERLASGVSVFTTDSRFKNEARAVTALGGVLVRLNITPETQEARIVRRDGIQISDEARKHPSETDLDDYADFTTALQTDMLTEEETVELLVAAIQEGR